MHTDKVNELKSIIVDSLSPIIHGKECVYIDLPYHTNIGDLLIWKGTECFMKEFDVKCLLRASKDTFNYPKLNPNTIILFHGGGNFGDIWIEHHKFRIKVIEYYKNNQIIILPQTVFYKNKETIISDAELLAQHKNLTIIGRDKCSYETLKKYYHRNNILMLPDMAFCINLEYLRKHCVRTTHKYLFFKRTDVEAKDTYNFDNLVPKTAEQHEWPTMESHPLRWQEKWLYRVRNHFPFAIDWYWNNVMCPYYVTEGVRFISSYNEVYTTRLHGAILSLLLGKPISFFDNSYGKNSSFYDTWLSDDKNIKFITT